MNFNPAVWFMYVLGPLIGGVIAGVYAHLSHIARGLENNQQIEEENKHLKVFEEPTALDY